MIFGKTQEKSGDLEFYTVFDSKSKSYAEPFPSLNRDTVLREFSNAFKHPDAPVKNRYYMNAEDFSIFKIGIFDQKTGRLSGTELEHIVNLHDLRAMSQPASPGPALLPT